jgi:hypothetical protein
MTSRKVTAGPGARFDDAKVRRYALIDLERADQNPYRGEFDAFVKSRVAELVCSDEPARFRAFWKELLVAAEARFPWRPPELRVRRVSLSPSSVPVVRHATRIISMVHELHKAGYQRVRMLPYLAPSGCYWRCAITYSDNVEDDGYHIREEADELVARYTTGDEAKYFGWHDAKDLSARQLAEKFVSKFSLIATRGEGRAWMYAGWVTDVLGRAEQGDEDALLFLIADWELDDSILRDWQPPPPLRR